MDQLHSEILLSIFKNLSSIDMVPVRAVCRNFLEIIDQNKSLWRHLVLPDSEQGGWDSKILDLWDEKSASSLKEISMKVKLEEDELNPFIKTLEQSKETLQICTISVGFKQTIPDAPVLFMRKRYSEAWSALVQLALVLPKVVDLRVMDFNSIHSVQLVENKVQEQKNAGLRILWLKTGSQVISKMMKSQLLNTLVSLKLEFAFPKSSELRAVLEGSSQMLKHLYLDLPEEKKVAEVLEFPLLECLETYSGMLFFRDGPFFPPWIKVPITSIVICDCITELPSVSRLWLKALYLHLLPDLGFRAPRMEELRIDSSSNLTNQVLPLLHQRKKNVEELLEVDGVRMIPLKRLGIWFDAFSSEQIDQLRGLVDEVFDLESVSMVVEIEI